MSKPKTIRLYPVPGVFADPWPSREFDATPDEWDAIREYVPVPFTAEPPDKAPAARETAPEADPNP
jgi:hypothetical protein